MAEDEGLSWEVLEEPNKSSKEANKIEKKKTKEKEKNEKRIKKLVSHKRSKVLNVLNKINIWTNRAGQAALAVTVAFQFLSDNPEKTSVLSNMGSFVGNVYSRIVDIFQNLPTASSKTMIAAMDLRDSVKKALETPLTAEQVIVALLATSGAVGLVVLNHFLKKRDKELKRRISTPEKELDKEYRTDVKAELEKANTKIEQDKELAKEKEGDYQHEQQKWEIERKGLVSELTQQTEKSEVLQEKVDNYQQTNAALEQVNATLRQTNATQHNTITSLEEKNTALGNKVTTLQKSNMQLGGQVTSAKQAATDADNRYNKLIGDLSSNTPVEIPVPQVGKVSIVGVKKEVFDAVSLMEQNIKSNQPFQFPGIDQPLHAITDEQYKQFMEAMSKNNTDAPIPVDGQIR